MEVIHVLPDNPTSVMQLLNASKEALTSFAARVINDVHDGNVNPLEIEMLCKKYEFVTEKIKAGIKENVKTEAAKYGEKPFGFAGAELHYTPTYTTYDYSACGDPEWQMLNEHLEDIKAKLKKREEWLKAMGGQEVLVNQSTGEVVTIYPPIKKSTMGVKVSLK